jgi:hypothetical protein
MGISDPELIPQPAPLDEGEGAIVGMDTIARASPGLLLLLLLLL